jgi:geranylgeranyl pyrophosphate synthase
LSSLYFYTPIQNDIEQVENLMRSQVDGYHSDLQKAFNHILSSGGKRIRTALTLLTGKMLGCDLTRLRILAAAIEMLHTATLVHDDLIDGSLLRRGIPTLNSQWSPGATVLTGDFIFAQAAKLAADAENIDVMKIFSQTLGVIVNGEISQLFSCRCEADREDYYRRIYAKTASLFETSTRTPAILGHASQEVIERMRVFGLNLGMGFQMVDDILDFTGEQATLGKPVGSDLRQGIITLPAIYYFESHASDPEISTLISTRCLGDEQQTNRLIDEIRNSDAINRSYEEVYKKVDESLNSLKLFPVSEERNALEGLAKYLTKRNY